MSESIPWYLVPKIFMLIESKLQHVFNFWWCYFFLCHPVITTIKERETKNTSMFFFQNRVYFQFFNLMNSFCTFFFQFYHLMMLLIWFNQLYPFLHLYGNYDRFWKKTTTYFFQLQIIHTLSNVNNNFAHIWITSQVDLRWDHSYFEQCK